MVESDLTPDEGDLYVSPDGNDEWSGTHPEPTDDGSDGPFGTIERVREAVRERSGETQTVWFRGGRHRLENPITLTPADPPTTYAAYPDERPVIDGGRRIDGWQSAEVNGTTVWRTTVPEVADGDWFFRQLFVDGDRRPRARFPTEGFYEIDDVPDAHTAEELWNETGDTGNVFVAPDGVVADWQNPGDVDVVIPHKWVAERSPVAAADPDTGRIELELYSKGWLSGDERFYVEHVFEALSDPGEWYLDRSEGDLFYVPKPGEDPGDAVVVAPVVDQFLRIAGEPGTKPVSDIQFRGLTFRHAGWSYPGRNPEYWERRVENPRHSIEGAASSIQAEFHVPGAISLEGATECEIVDCTVERVGSYGIRLGPGSTWNRIVGNEIRDLGAGGVKVTGGLVDESHGQQTGHNTVTDNQIHALGRVFHAGVGVLLAHAFDNDVSYNHIHDLYYTGVSAGWNWTFERQVARENRIAYNHIHDVGQGMLSDMGGVYTIGVQPGTVIEGNRIHEIEKYDYGGWGVYLDGASSHIVVVDNTVYDTDNESLHQHWGRGNDVRRNVFAFGGDGGFRLSRPAYSEESRRDYEDWHLTADAVPYSLIFERNVVLTANSPVIACGYGWDLDSTDIESDLNCFWDTERETPFCRTAAEEVTVDEWQRRGADTHSLVADPEITDAASRQFGFEDGPATQMGVDPVAPEEVGPRR